jgi:signal transduction histidine kinase
MVKMQHDRTSTQASEAQKGDGGTAIAGEHDVSTMRGLSGKLLVLTIIFVMIAEVLIFVPSVANFRNVWLRGHLDTAEAASIVFLDTADPMLSEQAQRELLSATGSLAVVIREGPMSRLMATSDMPAPIDHSIDLTGAAPVEAITGAISMLLSTTPGTYRVFQQMKSRPAVIELVQHDDRLKSALRIYSRNVLLISLAISVITAGLVFLALYRMIVRPVRNISNNMMAFAKEPDNAALIYPASERQDEIGIAERQLSAFQRELHQTLRQRQHLADLGLAVSKINHDLRNILASAQLFTDRLSQLPDPTVQRLAPKLLRAIDRAVDYTRSVLAYGKALEAPPDRRHHRLSMIVDDVIDLIAIEADSGIEWRKDVPAGLEVVADAEQLLRVMLNLARNSAQAIKRQEAGERSRIDRVTISAERENGNVRIRVADTGPGISEPQRENLFKAFSHSTAPGGTGLGLAIASELVRAHGGRIELESTSSAGTVFAVLLPDAAPSAAGLPASSNRRRRKG